MILYHFCETLLGLKSAKLTCAQPCKNNKLHVKIMYNKKIDYNRKKSKLTTHFSSSSSATLQMVICKVFVYILLASTDTLNTSPKVGFLRSLTCCVQQTAEEVDAAGKSAAFIYLQTHVRIKYL